MENTLTPEQVEAAAVKARLPLVQFLKRANIAPSVFYRWKDGAAMRPLTKAKLAEIVEAVK
jgi:hypothetical protein